MSTAGDYEVDAWLRLEADTRHRNDSLFRALKFVQLANPKIELPYQEAFTMMEEFSCSGSTIGLKGIGAWDYHSNSGGCLVNGYQSAGMISKEDGELDMESEDEFILTLNLSAMESAKGMQLTMSQFNYGDENKLWVRGDDTADWLEVMVLPTTDGWDWDTLPVIDLGNVLLENEQDVSSSFQLRFTRKGAGEFYLNHIFLEQVFLPTELINFTALKRDETVLLQWSTTSEKDNDYYEIEMAEGDEALDVGAFQTIGSVEAIGTSVLGFNYQYVDDLPWKFGSRHYRLKQYHVDGSFIYTDIQSLNFPEPVYEMSLYPNPFDESPVLEIISPVDGEIGFKLFNRLGQFVREGSQPLAKGYNNVDMNVLFGDLPKGVYLLQMTRGVY
ncbi:MAG: T9SS type A sorting domain-containing protein, partial [Bacteroidota bacterium]